MAQSDEQRDLIERARAGDSAAFERLIAAELPRVRRFARAACPRAHEADDLAQDALLKAFLALKSYRGDARFSTWLFRIVRNCMIDHVRSADYRRRLRQVDIESDTELALPEEEAPDAVFSRGQLRDQLWAALQSLPVEYRTAVVLFDVEGLSQEEVAEIEQVPTGTVKSRLSRGRRQLRAALEAAGVLSAGNEVLRGPVSSPGPAQ